MTGQGVAEEGPRVCTSCGTENPPLARFCNSCGGRLEAAVAPREERKLVSILFVDLVGFTARSDQADPEDVRDSLQLYHAGARQRIEQHGGVLEKFIGDAVMAVFGAPVAHGDDAERAVRAGLRVLEGIEELNREHDLGLAARAAVNTGDALVSLDAQDGTLATGDVVNTASRLQSAAPPGKLIVGAETYRATRHAIRYAELPAVDAKGKAEAVAAWIVLEAPAPEGRPAARTLVGRARELELIRSFWKRAVQEQRPHLITLVGPPGIGKSRLCWELSGLVAEDGGRVLRGRCLPYEDQAGYQAFSRLVHEASGILESDAPSAAREKLQAAVEGLLPEEEVAETHRYLSLLLGLAPEDQVPQMLLLYFAARRFIETAGLEQPTVFVFEDVHWAQSSELALLEYLAKHVRDAPVMLVAAARPELLDLQPTWGAGLTSQTMIQLDPLAPEAAAALAQEIVQSAGDVDFGRLVEVAGGNPLFLEELAASITDVGAGDELPVTVREAIAARIDALPPESRNALLAASVIGKVFWRDLLKAVGDHEEVDETLGTLEARDLIRRDPSSQLSGDQQFVFKHMLIREVAYSIVPRAARRERHAAVARYVEETLAGATETLSAILAYHWREAGEPARAIPYLLAAAESARRGWAKGAVVDLYSRALELAEDDEQRRDIRMKRGLALVELGDYPSADQELGELLPELQGQQRLDALIARAHATVWTEQDAKTLELAEEALALVDDVGDETALAAALAARSQGLAMRGKEEDDLDQALALGDQALEVWVPGTRALDLRHHLHLHADTLYWTGEYGRSLKLSQETRAVASDLHSAESLLRGGGMEALALAGLGRHEEAIVIFDELFEIARELGQRREVLLNYSALVYRELHDLDEARKRSEEALSLSAAMTFGMPRQFAGSDLLMTSMLSGHIGEAQAAWPGLWERAGKATGWTTWLVAGRLLSSRAEIALHAETPEASAEWAERAIQIARRTKRRKYETQSLEILGQALVKLGRRDEALQTLRSAVALADELVGPPARWRARATLGKVLYDLGDDDGAAAAYGEARQLVDGFVATLAPERQAKLLTAPDVEEIVSLAGRPVA
jgi:class 3 adenylate cyclase/tetratricopeptide (TPR) repeat protein/energy-coupling factor transporter ATP-binding protein EcfA2